MTRLKQEEKELHTAYVAIMQERLDWCVEAERYERAARLRDLIKYETTEDEVYKQQYFLNLAKKYSPEFYESIKHKYPKTLNV
jgi:hypothetical protein